MEENKEETVKTTLGKNKEGYGYQYTDLAEIHRYLEMNGMKYYQEIENINGNDYIMTYRFIDGKWEDKPKKGCKIVDATLSGIKNPAQEQGSALTYARRYSLLMAFGLATTDDDAQSLTMPAISTKEEAENYVLTFGKYAGKKLKELPESYIQWLFANTKDETIKTACDFIMQHITQNTVDLMAEFSQLIIQTETDREKLYANYGVKSDAELSDEQLKEAISILKKKLEKR